MKKVFFILSLFWVAITNSYSQGWVGNGGNNLNAVNSSLATTPINVGIGTNAPTAQFHTTGTVRHENLSQSDIQNQVLVTDALGNLYWRNASTLGSQNAWLLNGNAGTNSSTNFLGTTDNQNLSFRTNNNQRMTILASNGYVGVGVANPLVRLHVSNGLGTMGYPYESAVVENTGDTKFTVASSDPTGIGGSSIVLCNSNFTSSGVYHGYEMQYATNSGRWLRFNYIQRNAGGFISGGISNILILSDAGRVGVNLGPAGGGGTPVLPTANFHTSGTVRFQNLGAGSGNVLVIDANGNVFRSSTIAAKQLPVAEQELKNEINNLREELNGLKEKFKAIEKERGTLMTESNEAFLYQNSPNPFNQSTVIRYSIPSIAQKAVISISNMQGVQLRKFLITKENQREVIINKGELAAGTYIYSLIVDGELVNSKKMVLTN